MSDSKSKLIAELRQRREQGVLRGETRGDSGGGAGTHVYGPRNRQNVPVPRQAANPLGTGKGSAGGGPGMTPVPLVSPWPSGVPRLAPPVASAIGVPPVTPQRALDRWYPTRKLWPHMLRRHCIAEYTRTRCLVEVWVGVDRNPGPLLDQQRTRYDFEWSALQREWRALDARRSLLTVTETERWCALAAGNYGRPWPARVTVTDTPTGLTCSSERFAGLAANRKIAEAELWALLCARGPA